MGIKNLPGLTWELIKGDFLQVMEQAPAPPDIIFYDMFSGKTCASLWTWPAFAQIFDACRGRAVELFTYSCSTSARSAFLSAGFHVARGTGIGEKEQTSIVMTPAAATQVRHFRDTLGREWLARWERSSARYPIGVEDDEQRAAVAALIRGHSQFAQPPTRATPAA